MRSAMTLLIAIFAALASALVLLRLSLDESLGTGSAHIMYPLAYGVLALSLLGIAFATVTGTGRSRSTAPRRVGSEKSSRLIRRA
jgi:hypothetical protein